MKNFKGVKGEEKAGGIEKQPGHEEEVRVQRERIQSGLKGDKRCEGEGATGVLHWQWGPDKPGSTEKVYKLEESGKEVTVFADVGSSEEAGSQQERQFQE